MSKLLTLVAALTTGFVRSFAGPADAAQRKADGIQTDQAGQYEVSDQRRRHRRQVRRYYRPYYYGGYPYYGYRPQYYRPYYGYGYPYGYGAPGIGFNFRF